METMTKVKEVNVLKNRAECMNKVHSYCNKVVPELLEELSKGFKLTVNCQFFKKDNDRLNGIIGKISNKLGHGVRIYLESNEYSIILNVDTHYKVGEFSCNYYKKYVYLYNMQTSPDYNIFPKPYEFKPFQMVTEKQLIEAKERKQQLEAKKSNIKDELSTINLLLGS